jgi:hypothetical protein
MMEQEKIMIEIITILMDAILSVEDAEDVEEAAVDAVDAVDAVEEETTVSI